MLLSQMSVQDSWSHVLVLLVGAPTCISLVRKEQCLQVCNLVEH
jgi:hypothetical protein